MREVVLDQKLREGFVERTSSPLGPKCAIQYNCGRTMPSFVFVFIKGLQCYFHTAITMLCSKDNPLKEQRPGGYATTAIIENGQASLTATTCNEKGVRLRSS